MIVSLCILPLVALLEVSNGDDNESKANVEMQILFQ